MWLGVANRSLTNAGAPPPINPITLYHGQTFTITGPPGSFGPKSRAAAPIIYDTATAARGTTDSHWTDKAPSTAGGIYNIQLQSFLFNPSGAPVPVPDPFLPLMYAGCHLNQNSGTGGNSVELMKSFPCPDQTLAQPYAYYANFKQFVDGNWPFGDNSGPTNQDNNFKWFTFCHGSSIGFGNNDFCLYICTPTTPSSNTGLTQGTSFDFTGSFIHNPDNNGHNIFWPGSTGIQLPPLTSFFNQSNGFVDLEIDSCASLNSSFGAVNIRGNRGLTVNYRGTHESTIVPSALREFEFGTYARSRGPTAFRYMAGPIVGDVSGPGVLHVARLMIGDNQTLANCTFLEYMPASVWVDTSITAQCWQGRAVIGQTMWLFPGTEADGMPATSTRPVTIVAQPFDFFISPSGSNANDGLTPATAWSLTAINTKRGTYAGKRVGLLPGTYNCLSLIGGSYTGDFATPAFMIQGGSQGSPTVICAAQASGLPFPPDSSGFMAPGFTTGVWKGPILDAGATSGNNTQGQPLIGSITAGGVLGAGYVTIDGLEIKNTYGRPLSIGADTGVPFAGTRTLGIVVQNCYIHDLTNNIGGANPTGITIYASDGAIVQNNRITRMFDNFSRASGIETWTSINTITQYNTVISASSQQIAGIQHKNTNQSTNVLRYNYVDMTLTGGLGSGAYGIGHDSDGDVTTYVAGYGNIVICDEVVLDANIGSGGYPSTAYLQYWYGNTFVGVPNSSVVMFRRFGGPNTIAVYNNIIKRGTVGGKGDVDTSVSALNKIDYNCYPATPVLCLTADGTFGNPASTTSSLATWATQVPAACIGKDAHSILGDPLFVGSGTEAQAYKLQGGSPCKNAGRIGGVSTGLACDMGAWGCIDLNTNATVTQIGSSF